VKLSGARILVECLRREQVEVIFGLPGGATLPVYDALYQQEKPRHVLVRIESGAGFAADAYARVSGRTGVVLVTSGPAVTNLLTALQCANMDSVPIVAFTGQVPTSLMGRDAFQEADNIGLTRTCTKHNFLVRDASELAGIVKEAFYIASTGRPGPVHVDLPKDVLMSEADFHYPDAVLLKGYRPRYEGHLAQIRKAAAAISRAKRPVLIAGGGVVSSNAAEELRALAERAHIPVTTTLMAIGGFPSSHPLAMGMLGMHGTFWANTAVYHSDCLVAVGARFDDRVTGRVEDFAPRAHIVQIDIDPTSISKNLVADTPIVGDARCVLTKLLLEIDETPRAVREPWLARIAQWRSEHPLRYEWSEGVIKPQYLIQEISRLLPTEAVVVTGVGQHQMWAAQHVGLDRPRCWCTSGGLGAMGYGLPAAIGAQTARPDALVVNIDGDGSFVITSQELATVVEAKLPVKIVIVNNSAHGMVRQWQKLLYGGRYNAVDLSVAPDFSKLAEAYGCAGIRVTKPHEVGPTLERAFAGAGPVVIDVVVDREECVFPMVRAGDANKDMLLEPPNGPARVTHGSEPHGEAR
jgi:acetolactate synthase I/II/III large subunit